MTGKKTLGILNSKCQKTSKIILMNSKFLKFSMKLNLPT